MLDTESNHFGEFDSITIWYLNEIAYCLNNYLEMSWEDAYEMIVSSDYLDELLDDDPKFLQTESPFYWTMVLAQKGMWWLDKDLKSKNEEYVTQHRRPPEEDNEERLQ